MVVNVQIENIRLHRMFGGSAPECIRKICACKLDIEAYLNTASDVFDDITAESPAIGLLSHAILFEIAEFCGHRR